MIYIMAARCDCGTSTPVRTRAPRTPATRRVTPVAASRSRKRVSRDPATASGKSSAATTHGEPQGQRLPYFLISATVIHVFPCVAGEDVIERLCWWLVPNPVTYTVLLLPDAEACVSCASAGM